MANPEHLKILKQGVELWNQWRKENPKIQPDLTETDFTGENLSGINFSGTDLRASKFYKGYFGRNIFADVDLSQAKGLESCLHFGPSSIDHMTLIKSGPLPSCPVGRGKANVSPPAPA